MKASLPLLALSLFLAGCATPTPNSELLKTVDLSSMKTFSYKHTLVSGMDMRGSDELYVKKLSEEVLTEAFTDLGYESVEEGADFYVVAKWRKAVSNYPDKFDHIDGPLESLNQRRTDPGYRFASRYHLSVEVYDSATDEVFWREELPNIFDATQFTEERVSESLKRAVKDFPKSS